jgi:hypothetical protein
MNVKRISTDSFPVALDCESDATVHFPRPGDLMIYYSAGTLKAKDYDSFETETGAFLPCQQVHSSNKDSRIVALSHPVSAAAAGAYYSVAHQSAVAPAAFVAPETVRVLSSGVRFLVSWTVCQS